VRTHIEFVKWTTGGSAIEDVKTKEFSWELIGGPIGPLKIIIMMRRMSRIIPGLSRTLR
jgi:hypothetical protein